MFSLFNLSLDQTFLPSGEEGIPPLLCFATTAQQIGFMRAQLTAPLSRGVAQGLVPGGG